MKINTILSLSVLVLATLQIKADKFPFPKTFEKKIIKTESQILSAPEPTVKERTSKQAIKLNIIPLMWKNISLQYEYSFHKNLSGALGVSYFVKRPLPAIFFTPNTTQDGWQTPYMSGFAVTPEFRFYPGAKTENQAPNGFYIAPYLRYSSVSLKADYFDIGFDANNIPYNNQFEMKATYAGVAGGLMIGSQWIISKHLAVDWWIIGGGAGTAKLTLKAEAVSGNVNMTEIEQTNLQIDITNNASGLGRYGNGTIKVETTSNSAKATISGLPMSSFRGFGVAIGYAF